MLYVANEQAAITGAIDAVESTINIASPAFSDGDVIIVDSEEMRVLSGGGTTSLTVQRAIYGTQPAVHAQGAVAYTACNYTGLTLTPVDISSSDESSWCTLALTQAGLDAAIPGSALFMGDKPYNTKPSFWRRIHVPAGTGAQKKTDIKLRLTGTMNLV